MRESLNYSISRAQVEVLYLQANSKKNRYAPRVAFLDQKCIFLFQAPFYPHEAEKKGCVPSEYGLVFGIFELTVFLVSPIIGANLNR